MAPFLLYRIDNHTVQVEACGWFGPDFVYRLIVQTNLERAVRMADAAAQLLDLE